MQNLGRNEPCHCGSGKKYKNCHQLADTNKASSSRSLWIGGIFIALIIVSVLVMILNSQSSERGEAPPGKVWSEEHGHYHDK